MVIPKDKHQISMNIDQGVYEDLLGLSEQMALPVSKIARNLLYAGLDQAQLLKNKEFIKESKITEGFSKRINNLLFWGNQGARPFPSPTATAEFIVMIASSFFVMKTLGKIPSLTQEASED